MAQQVPCMVAELGADVAPFLLHIYAALADNERRLIGERTRATLQRKVAQGWKAGNPSLARHRSKPSKTNAEKADELTRKVMPTIQRMLNDGMNCLAIARELNATGMSTARGGAWTGASVGNVMRRRGCRRQMFLSWESIKSGKFSDYLTKINDEIDVR